MPAHPACLHRDAGENRITWPNGCCGGDLITIDFRDEQADGNAGYGILYINNTETEPNSIETYAIEGFTHGLWKTYGPFCAYEGWHNLSFTSDANPDETTFTITDSFGLIKAAGGMSHFPKRFHTIAPSKFCTPDGGLDSAQMRKRNRKLIAAKDQRRPREQLIAEGFAVPQDPWGEYPPLSVYNNSGSTRPPALRTERMYGSEYTA